MTVLTTPIDGLKMAYTVEGDPSNPPIVFIHGWGMSKELWRTTIPYLADQYYCIAVDLIGFGDSEIPKNGDYAIPTQAKRVMQLVTDLGFDRVTLMGHSMGGQISLYIASTLTPERVVQLINVDGAVQGKLAPETESTFYHFRIGYHFPPYFTPAYQLVHTRWYTKFFFRYWFHNFDVVPLDFWFVDRRRICQPKVHRSMYPALKEIYACNLTESLHRITAPVLTIFGRYDKVVPPADGELVAQHVPDHQAVWVEDCGHFPMYEKPEIYREAVRAFLYERSPV